MGIQQRLRDERMRLGHSQDSAGSIGGVRKQAQHLYESGERHPDTRYLLRLQAGGFDVPYILTGERTPAAALQAHINAAQFTIKRELDEESVQLLAQSWVDQAPYSVATREQEEELLRLFRGMSEQSKNSLLAIAKSLK